MYRKSKWKRGYDLEGLGHGEFLHLRGSTEDRLFLLALRTSFQVFHLLNFRECSNYFWGSFRIGLLFTSGRF